MIKTIQTETVKVTMVAPDEVAAAHILQNVQTAASLEMIIEQGGVVYSPDGEERVLDYVIVQNDGTCIFVSATRHTLDTLEICWDGEKLEIASISSIPTDTDPTVPEAKSSIALSAMLGNFNATRRGNKELLQELNASGYHCTECPVAVMVVGLERIGD